MSGEITARIDPSLISVCRALSDATDAFVSEALELVDDDFEPWIDTNAYEGAWRVHPVSLAHGDGPEVYDLAANRARCPQTARVFDGLPRIHIASISRLMPGTRLPLHTDYPKHGVLRIHIGLRGYEGAWLELPEGRLQLEPGELLIFDHSVPHSAWNEGSEPRDIVLVDYEVSEDEARLLHERRGGVNLGPRADEREDWRAPE